MPYALFAIAAALVLYILAGYPLAVAWIRWRTAPPPAKHPRFRTSVSVLLAVHNGQEFIRRKLESLLALEYPRELMEILVISDGSVDGTDAIVKEYAGEGVRLLRIEKAGKAAALNAGLRQASGEILFFTDVRQELDRAALGHLVANFADPSIGVVSGELRILNPDHVGQQADLDLYWRYELFVRQKHAEIDSMFSATGCIYAMRRKLASEIPPDTLSDDVVLPQQAFFQGYRVILDQKALAFDHPTTEGGEFRRKLRTLAGVWQVYARRPALLTGANRMRLHFFSHRFARLVLPWGFLAVLGAVIAFPASLMRTALLGGTALLLLLGAADRYLKGLPLRRLSSPAKTIVSMNLAALFAIVVFFVPPNLLWRPTRVKTTQ
jgi:cellulose synthase/poly-beta-1,6-N-acetylglucosamine synthase-like glycosyltransferase